MKDVNPLSIIQRKRRKPCLLVIETAAFALKYFFFSAVVVVVVVDAKKVGELCRLKPFAEFQSPDERNFV